MSKINLDEFFLSCLGSVEDLKRDLNYDINLIDTADKRILLATDIILALIPKAKKQEMFEDIDMNSILDLLRKERPDLYKVFMEYPNGRIWIQKQIEIMRKRFL